MISIAETEAGILVSLCPRVSLQGFAQSSPQFCLFRGDGLLIVCNPQQRMIIMDCTGRRFEHHTVHPRVVHIRCRTFSLRIFLTFSCRPVLQATMAGGESKQQSNCIKQVFLSHSTDLKAGTGKLCKAVYSHVIPPRICVAKLTKNSQFLTFPLSILGKNEYICTLKTETNR